MPDPVKEDLPPCYGDPKLWSPQAKECTGGTDAAYTDDKGGHVRPKCMFFESCGVKAQASKMEQARSLIDPRSIVRTDAPVLSPVRSNPPSQLSGFVDRFAQAVGQQQAAQPPTLFRPVVQQTTTQQVVQPVAYQQMMPVNFQMPGYLSVPEPRLQGQSFWQFLGLTVFRALGKSVGHAIAHLFDTVPLGTTSVGEAFEKSHEQ